jgi:DNA replication protein DnaC
MRSEEHRRPLGSRPGAIRLRNVRCVHQRNALDCKFPKYTNEEGLVMNIEGIQQQLKALKLPTAAGELEVVLHRHKQAVDLGWVAELLEREIDARRERALQKRIERAEFPEVTTLEAFDWKFNPKIDRSKIEELAKLDFVRGNRIGLFLGAAGLGKTHFALALGVLAAKEGYRVFCASTKKLIQLIDIARQRNELDGLFKRMLSSKLWIIDDWGVVSMKREIAEEVFDLFDRRKYSSAMLLTSNRDVEEWGEVFPDPVLANATVDRIFDRAEIVVFQGKSYRLKGRITLPSINPSEIGKTPKLKRGNT